jgi:hypothetical protein
MIQRVMLCRPANCTYTQTYLQTYSAHVNKVRLSVEAIMSTETTIAFIIRNNNAASCSVAKRQAVFSETEIGLNLT